MSIRWSAMFFVTAFVFILPFATALQAQSPFSIRAASPESVVGWQRKPVERSNRLIWVSPVEAVTAPDIEKAAPDHTSVEGQTRVAVVFTDAGAKHFADLTTAQLHKGIAMVLDGKVIWAPLVMAEFHADVGKDNILAGSGPQGLTQQEVERIMVLVTCGIASSTRTCAIPLPTLPFASPLAAQQSIPFDICAQSTTWTRPSPEVQAKIWNDPRYSSFGRTDYAWTHNFIVIDDPLSASIPYHLMNLSGLWTEAPFNNKCDADPNNRRNGNEWIEVWVLRHRVTQVTRENNTYTITVEPTGKGFQFVYIRRLNPSAVLRFITPDGKEVEKWDESAPPNRVKNEIPPGTRIIGPNGEKIITK